MAKQNKKGAKKAAAPNNKTAKKAAPAKKAKTKSVSKKAIAEAPAIRQSKQMPVVTNPAREATRTANPTPPGGRGNRYFAEQDPAANGNKPWNAADDNGYYNSTYYTQHEKSVQPFSPSKSPAYMNLSSVLPAASISKIQAAKQITFHMNGDTGGSTQSKFNNEVSVVDLMVQELTGDNAASFFFHLGDVVYNFGEEDYYYDQFYDPFRTYNAPIFAIPGNHDGMVFNDTMVTLQAFIENFCTNGPQTAPNAGGLIRTTMDQPGVYFTLDAPFVSIIGLYSNVIDGGPGVISTQGGKFPVVTDVQLDFLNSELARLKTKRQTDPRAILLAVHHPPFSGDAKHGGSPLMSRDLDNAFTKAGLWPDAVISGHAHHYERFQRTISGKNIPYIIAGSGGYNNTPMPKPPTNFPFPIPGNPQLTLEKYFSDYGYLTLNVNAASKKLTITFNTTNKAIGTGGKNVDSVVVNW
jgi:hypothetical protein